VALISFGMMYFPYLAALLPLFGSFAWALTNFTGDIINGYTVITSLDLTDVPANAVTRYWLLAAEAQGGIPYFLPVFVARGSDESLKIGRKLSLSASIHGDEYNGIAAVQRVFRQLNAIVQGGEFNGTIIGLPTMNPNGNQHNQRNFYSSSENGFLTNLNRVFPGADPLEGAAIPDAYAYAIWNNLWGNTSNVDVAVDLRTLCCRIWLPIPRSPHRTWSEHFADTPTTGDSGPLWCYADFRLPYVQRLAELAQPDIIKIDPGEPGSIETTWVDNSVPAITLEIGTPKRWEPDYIQRTEDYIFRLLADLHMTPASSRTSTEIDLSNTYKATNISNIHTTRTGWVETFVDILDDVTDGQQIGKVYNSWGDVIENLTSTVNGRVLQLKTDPAAEQGARVCVVAYNAEWYFPLLSPARSAGIHMS
jgi:predicted deacylase